ncbi:MAG: hypothetical protein HFH92_06195 [Lachnospiraceae bacterium]|uniref:hypothetical protein n=1 Tax=uncultured Acetatifactor sp. TaxID=1671927 RepID=UPI00262E133F|nr:hypothetical protein [uncultured Acetatifactor sp.]MCI8788688.1 hypothetical protein [Lachnospiraceae bacterium]
MMESTSEIMNKGMKCLMEQMGIIEAERFISVIIRVKFDYTKWQRDYFDAKTPMEIREEAFQFEREHPFTGDAIRL